MLKDYLKIDYDTFYSRANKKNDPYEEIADRLTQEHADEINSLKIKGISVHKDSWRYYPNENLASHSIGFLAYKGDDLVGQYGLERYYEKTLSKPKEEAYVNFLQRFF